MKAVDQVGLHQGSDPCPGLGSGSQGGGHPDPQSEVTLLPLGDHGPLSEPAGSLGHSTPNTGPQPKLQLQAPTCGTWLDKHRRKTRAKPWRPLSSISGLQHEVPVSLSLACSPLRPCGSYCPCPAPDLGDGLRGLPAGGGGGGSTHRAVGLSQDNSWSLGRAGPGWAELLRAPVQDVWLWVPLLYTGPWAHMRWLSDCCAFLALGFHWGPGGAGGGSAGRTVERPRINRMQSDQGRTGQAASCGGERAASLTVTLLSLGGGVGARQEEPSGPCLCWVCLTHLRPSPRRRPTGPGSSCEPAFLRARWARGWV